jgi:antitoxin (DNA-binding transcriptional repressor) of toxin-antitoxin stability system
VAECISDREFRRRLGSILDRVHGGGERFLIERGGRAVAAVIPVDTLRAMDGISRMHLRKVLLGRRSGTTGEVEADALADEAKHRSR